MKKHTLKKYSVPLLGAFIIGVVLTAAAMLFVEAPEKVGVDIADVPFYFMPFGKDKDGKDRPFWPSRVKTTDGRFADPKNIPSAAECVKCHQQEFEDWAGSLHAISGRDAIYDKVIDFNEHFNRKNGAEQVRFCEGCHEPGEVTLGRTNRVGSVMPSDAETEGLTCIFCHAAVHADPIKGNGDMTIALNDAKDKLSNAFIMASPRDHARAFGAKSTGALITKSDFCGACHTETYHPGVSKAAEGTVVQSTYAEWKESWYAKNDITCQDCHMNPKPADYIKQLAKGKISKPERYVHTFVGANYLQFETALKSNIFFLRGGIIPGLTGKRYLEIIDKQKHVMHKFLKAAARLEVRKAWLVPGEKSKVKIAVMNVGAGHNLPTGVSDQKYMWLELELTDATGRKFYHSGWFDDKLGEHDPKAVIWREQFWDEDGVEIKDHLTFNTAAVTYKRPLIPARGEDVVEYDLDLPKDLQGPVTLKTRLWYRVALQDIVSRVIKANIVIPPFLFAETEAIVPLGKRTASR
jgi:nitrate/TMAO reductase-like tetraheme cytochrome c subunit